MRYTFLMPNSPAFAELTEAYRRVAERRDDVRVVMGADGEQEIVRGEGDFFVCYQRPYQQVLRTARRNKVAFVYTEPFAPESAMSADHRAYKRAFFQIAPWLDGVIAHTPEMCDQILAELKEMGFNKPVGVVPAGLDNGQVPESARWTTKDIDFLFYGSMSGKRRWALPLLKEKLGDRLVIAEGVYGDALYGLLVRTKVSVYVAHADVTSFSTHRIWHELPLGVTMAIECLSGRGADAWPLCPYYHYVPLPTLTQENADEYVKKLEGALTWEPSSNLASIASTHNTEFCIDSHLASFAKLLERP